MREFLYSIIYDIIKDVTLPKNDVRTDDIRSANAKTSTCAIRTLVISHHESGLQRRAAAPTIISDCECEIPRVLDNNMGAAPTFFSPTRLISNITFYLSYLFG